MSRSILDDEPAFEDENSYGSEASRLEMLQERAEKAEKMAECAVALNQDMADALLALSDRFGFMFKEMLPVARRLHKAPTYTHGLYLTVPEPSTFRYTVSPATYPTIGKKRRKARKTTQQMRLMLSVDGK